MSSKTMSKLSDSPVVHSRLVYVAISVALVTLLAPDGSTTATDFLTGFWKNASITIEQYDGRIYFVSAIVLTTLLLTLHPQSLIRRSLYYIPILLLFCAYRAPLGTKDATGASTGSYQFGILLASWTMRILDRLYLHQPEETFRYAEDVQVSPVNYTTWKKLAWAVELMAVTRGIGWNWQIRQIPPMPKLTRRGFLLWKAKSAAFTVFMLYIIRAASRFFNDMLSATTPKSSMEILGQTIVLHIFMYASWAFVVYSSLNLAENLFALFFVGLRLTTRWSRPEMWPPVFGHVKESYSIRRGWGVFWHQNMRRVCQSTSEFLVSQIPSLRKPQSKSGVLTRRYLRLLFTFVFSGIIHAGGSIYMTQKQTSVHDGGNILGFLYQGFSLIAEDIILAKLGIDDSQPQSLLRRAIGFAIVHGYGSYATPTLKVIPLAQDHGIKGSPLVQGVKMVEMGAFGVLKNPFATMVGSFNV